MKVLGMLTLWVIRFFADGWCVWMLWNWFAAPLGAPTLTYWQAVGVDLIVGLFMMFAVTTFEGDAEKRLNLVLAKLFVGPLFVGIGWLIVSFAGVAR